MITQIPLTDLEEARNIFSFLQVPGAIQALRIINNAGPAGATAEQVVSGAKLEHKERFDFSTAAFFGLGSSEPEPSAEQIAGPVIDRLRMIGFVIEDAGAYKISPAITLTGQRVLFALFPPVETINEPLPMPEAPES